MDGSEFNQRILDRTSFLSRGLAYGHWDLLQPDDIKFIPRDELVSVLKRDKPSEQWLAELLKDVTDAEAKVAVLTDPILETSYQRIFYSEPTIFQHYLQLQLKDQLPMLTLESQMRYVLVTSLPEDLLELKPSRFWKFWVIDIHTLLTPFRMTAVWLWMEERSKWPRQR